MKNFISVLSPLIFLAAVAVIVIGYTKYTTPKNTATPTTLHTFVYGNGDPNDYSEGDETFGTEDSLGVWQDVLNSYPNEMPNFEYIHNKIGDRETFIEQSQGVNYPPLSDPTNHWQTIIGDVHQVNGETRFEVASSIGKDVEQNLSIIQAIDVHTVYELWKHVPGAQPVLLDRSLDLAFIDGKTHTEEPHPLAGATGTATDPYIDGLTGDMDDAGLFD